MRLARCGILAGLLACNSGSSGVSEAGLANRSGDVPDASATASPDAATASPDAATASPDAATASPDAAIAADARGTADAEELSPRPACEHPAVVQRCESGVCSIPPGCFIMGAPRQELFAAAASDVQVEVQLTRGFRIGQTEVTRAQWLALGLPEPRVDWRRTGSDRADVPPAGYSPCNEPDCPVLWISYEDGMAYTNLLSEREGLEPCYQLSDCVRSAGDNMRCQSVRVNAPNPYECRGYRLPTAAEWEYATRAGTKGAYYSGDMHSDPNVADNCGLDPNLDKIGWYCGNSGSPPGQPGGRAHPVAQKQPNAWGLYDTSGNAYEWVNDLFNPLGYGRGPLTDPVGGVSDPSDLTPAKHPVWGDYRDPEGFPGAREYRGGAFDLWSSLAKSSRRLYMSVGGQHTGFRVARSVQP